MPTIKCQAILLANSGLPKDNATNSWFFTGPNDAASVAQLATDVLHFYDTNNPAGDGPGRWLAQSVTGVKVKAYDIGGPPPHVPLAETLVSDPDASVGLFAGATNLASELAVVLSFQGLPVSGQVQSRKRGRIYFGPLNSSASFVSGVGHAQTPARPAGGLTSALLNQAQKLKTAAAGHGYTWVVHSPTGGIDTPVHDVWADNGFDVQRRRGVAATIRNPSTLI